MAREMKYSGVKWIGEIPKGWEVKKLKYLIRKPLQYGANESGVEYDESLPRYIRITDITMDNKLKDDGKLSLEYDKAKPYILEDEDLLFARSGASVGKTFLYKREYGFSAFAGYLIKASFDKIKVSPSYFYYNTLSSSYESWKQQAFTQATIQNIGADKYNTLIVPSPPLSEQQAIADFLDAKCAEIDGLLADLDAEVKTLAEYKKSIIVETVTRGLNPNAQMKQSGIPWAETIPAHWTTARGKYALHLLQRQVKEDDGVVTCFRDGQVTLRSNRREDGFTMSDKEYGYQGIEPGDLVVHGMDGFAGAIGISDSRGKGTPVLNVLDSDNNKRFLMYYLRNMAYGNVFLALSTGIRVRSCDLSWKKLGEIRIVLPPIEEQEAIAAYLDEKCAIIDQSIADKQTQIETLKSYKASLIYEYVTGKKQVI